MGLSRKAPPARSKSGARPSRIGGRLRSVFLAVGTAVLALFCGLLAFDKILMPRVVGHGDEVRIPGVAGKDLGQAEALLRGAGLAPVRAAGRYHPDMPRGSVLEVYPSVGLSVKRGRQVFLTPSLGAVNRRVPDLAGLTVRMARIRLADLGLRIAATEYAATDLVPADQVLAVTPDAGAPAPENGEMSLLVSRNRAPTPYWMPDLRGESGADMSGMLEDNGFRSAVTTGSAAGPAGTVARQDPEPGTPVWPGARVQLTVTPGRSAGAGANRRRRW